MLPGTWGVFRPGMRFSDLKPEGPVWSFPFGDCCFHSPAYLWEKCRAEREFGMPRLPGHYYNCLGGRGLKWSALSVPLQVSLQFPDPGLGGHTCLPLIVGAGFEVLVSDDVVPSPHRQPLGPLGRSGRRGTPHPLACCSTRNTSP